jgi:hypothetical protein
VAYPVFSAIRRDSSSLKVISLRSLERWDVRSYLAVHFRAVFRHSIVGGRSWIAIALIAPTGFRVSSFASTRVQSNSHRTANKRLPIAAAEGLEGAETLVACLSAPAAMIPMPHPFAAVAYHRNATPTTTIRGISLPGMPSCWRRSEPACFVAA